MSILRGIKGGGTKQSATVPTAQQKEKVERAALIRFRANVEQLTREIHFRLGDYIQPSRYAQHDAAIVTAYEGCQAAYTAWVASRS